MAPPKRKTGSGRVTPKGTKPGALPTAGSPRAKSGTSTEHHGHPESVAPSSRYTPPVHSWEKESPRWWPILMLALFGIGGAMILLKYLQVLPTSNWWIAGGLVFILSGLFASTRWR